MQFAYFDVKISDQEKGWAAHNVCYVYVENLRKYSKKSNENVYICSMHGMKSTTIKSNFGVYKIWGV